MGKIIATANQKGGVAKTTTAVNLGASLSLMGQPVLLVDIDPQGNASSGLGIDKTRLERCVYDVLINDMTAKEAIIHTGIKYLDVLPSTIQLAGAEVEMVSLMAREQILKRALSPLKEKYNYIIIDCPPSLGLLTLNALAASDSLLIPIQCEFYALEGVGQLMNTVQLVKKHLNPSLEIEGVLLTMFDARLNLSIQVVDEVKKVFGTKVFQNIIPRNVRLSEAPSHGMPVVLYDPKSKGSEAYQELAKEVMGIE
ncbi:chromosome segregation ATPase [Desulforamulus reducens MI-1]|uniref:Sporulation initiation inhibitor protein Soj n=1 Tax=Desulforamulus reducens (strain ATCC BAA-1160 / DSM 100696 / MI-1) TaxID=349161 RepID=A4J9R8_DESRM|nr:AAA family ATPase [Desulforamulus reducens]ABO51821.1 chromosome segregation ATPase [Desulforamulus reducens MI-1]